MSVSFDNLWLARKTVLNLTIEKDTKRPRSMEALNNSIGGCFHKDVWVDWNSGTRECNALKASGRYLFQVCVVFPLLERFKSAASYEQISHVIRYFRAQYLTGLTLAKYWDNWNSIEDLLAYIEEAPDALYSIDAREQILALCPAQAEVFAFDAILGCLSPTQRKYWGYVEIETHPDVPKDKNLFKLLGQVYGMDETTNDQLARSVQVVIGQKDISYDPAERANNSEFYTWVEQLNSLKICQWLLDSSESYWRKLHRFMSRNLKNVLAMDAYLYDKPFIDKHSALAFLQAAYNWMKKQTEQATTSTSNPEPSSSRYLTTTELIASLEKTVEGMEANDCTKQAVFKMALVNQIAKRRMHRMWLSGPLSSVFTIQILHS